MTALTDLVDRLRSSRGAMLEELEALVRCESPSADRSAVRRCADLLSELAAPYVRAAPDSLVVDGVTHLRWQLGDPAAEGRVLLVGHLDTVWPIGSLDSHPFSVHEGRATGPGCFDMKAGLVQMLHALGALDPGSPVTVLVTGDEETGSATSRALIEESARNASAALVCEPSAAGALKSARKGVSLYEIAITGRAAHAGLEPEKGVNAAVELAHQVLAVAQFGDATEGTTVTPTLVSAGVTTNTVPHRGTIAVDVRVTSVPEQERVDRVIRGIAPQLRGATIEVHGGANRPPLPTSASVELVRLAQRVAGELGLVPPDHVAVGGGSDGNFTAGVGTPTLDGLGAVGGGAHADDEHVLVEDMGERAALLAGLVRALVNGAR
ncbi:MAG TPA: M20 family metallopeptidase [Acidimicrobiales bacterium]|nr:M20 family metallopeptidase [Acidimicrobiales bacterium]